MWNEPAVQTAMEPAMLILLGITLILVHEVIHGAAALLFVDRHAVRFGFSWLAIVCKVKVPMKRNHYIIYALAPAAIFAAAGIVASTVVGDPEMRFMSTLFLLVGGVSSGAGDFWFVLQALKYPPDVYVLDNGIEMDILERDPAGDNSFLS